MHSHDAEVMVVGAMLAFPCEAIPDVQGIVSTEDFFLQRNRVLFETMCRLWEAKRTLDPVMVKEALRASEKLEEAGGLGYLSGLLDMVPSPANVAHHAAIVCEGAVLRRLARAAEEIGRDVRERGERTVTEIADAAEARILAARRGLVVSEFAGAGDLVDGALRDIEAAEEGKVLAIPSGFAGLDHMLGGGSRAGDLSIAAGRPSMGKTSWVLNVARNAAETVPVAVLSLEMSSGQCVGRLLSAEGWVDGQAIRTGRLDPEARARLERAAKTIGALPLYVDDNPGQTISEVRAKARRLVSAKGVRLIVVDYLQLLSGTRTRDGNRVQEVSEISRGLKLMAKELDVAVLAVSQLSRAVEARTDKRPLLSDLRESGSIEQDADVVMFLYRPEYYANSDQAADLRGKAELIVAKQRNGPTGSIALRFERAFSRFSEQPSPRLRAA